MQIQKCKNFLYIFTYNILLHIGNSQTKNEQYNRFNIIELEESKNRIHGVFYILSGLALRKYMNYDIFKVLLREYKIPLYFILAKIQNTNVVKNDKPFVIRNYNKVIKINDDFRSYIRDEKITKKY